MIDDDGKTKIEEQVRLFCGASGFSLHPSTVQRVRAGLDAAGVVVVPLSDAGVLIVLRMLDAAMDSIHVKDRKRVAKAFARKYANDLSDPGAPELTPKEWAVLRCLAGGLGTGGTARHLGIAPRTVSQRVEKMIEKFGANDRTHVVAEAFRRGML